MDETTLATHAAAIVAVCTLVKKYAPALFRLWKLPRKLLWVSPLLVAAAGGVVGYLQEGLSVSDAIGVAVFSWLSAMGIHAVGKQSKKRDDEDDIDRPGRVIVPPALLVMLLVLIWAPPLGCQQLKQTDWPEVVQCGPDVTDLVAVVSRVLLGQGNVRGELEQLATAHGFDTVACLVDYLREDWLSAGASASPERIEGINRATAFLAEVGTKIERE